LLDALAFGPEHAVRYIRSHELWPSERWTDPVWADGGTVVDLDRRRMLFFGEELATTMPERRAMLDVLPLMWPDYSVGWAYGGTDELIDYVGAERDWERGRPAQELKLARGRKGLFHVVSVLDAEGELRLWPLWWGCSAAWHGPALLDELPGKGVARLNWREFPESGVHVDVPAKTVGAWGTWESRGLFDVIPQRWPGWRTEVWYDGYEEQLSRCEGALRLPELDPAAGVVHARDWLRKRVFQSFEDSPAGAIAGLVKTLDPTGPDFQPGMNSVINSPLRPTSADWNRFETACGRQQLLYTKAS
jgi:hypothetical protein